MRIRERATGMQYSPVVANAFLSLYHVCFIEALHDTRLNASLTRLWKIFPWKWSPGHIGAVYGVHEAH